MRRVLLVSDSLFADTLRQTLSNSDAVVIVGYCTAPEQLPASIAASNPDAVLVVGAEQSQGYADAYLRLHCELPIIYTALDDDHMTIFTSRRVKAAQSQLMAALTALPDRT